MSVYETNLVWEVGVAKGKKAYSLGEFALYGPSLNETKQMNIEDLSDDFEILGFL